MPSTTESTPAMAPAAPARPRRFAVLRSLAAVIRDPNQTAHGARLVLAIDAEQMAQNYRDFADDPEGRRILDGAPTLFDRLTDRAALERLPDASLGREYLAFVEREGISTEVLDAEVGPVEEEILHPDERQRRFGRHMRASHDLWHVLTGYQRDILGEIQLIVFSHQQTGSRAFGWLSRIARVGPVSRFPKTPELLDLAEARGRAAPCLATQRWEVLLPLPIAVVRERLRIGPPPVYTRLKRKPSGFGLMPEEVA